MLKFNAEALNDLTSDGITEFRLNSGNQQASIPHLSQDSLFSSFLRTPCLFQTNDPSSENCSELWPTLHIFCGLAFNSEILSTSCLATS